TGAMALSWTMDKLGPLCRAVEDCALVLSAIYGPDGKDRSVQNAAFNWDAHIDVRTLRVGYLKSDFEGQAPTPQEPSSKEAKDLTPEEAKKRAEEKANAELARSRQLYDKKYNDAALAKLKDMGI